MSAFLLDYCIEKSILVETLQCPKNTDGIAPLEAQPGRKEGGGLKLTFCSFPNGDDMLFLWISGYSYCKLGIIILMPGCWVVQK